MRETFDIPEGTFIWLVGTKSQFIRKSCFTALLTSERQKSQISYKSDKDRKGQLAQMLIKWSRCARSVRKFRSSRSIAQIGTRGRNLGERCDFVVVVFFAVFL